MEKQFEGFRVQLEESGSVMDRIRAVAMGMESATGLIHASLLLVHQSLLVPEVLEKARVHIEVLKGLFGQIAEILKECPGQYYRYHGDWRSETQTAVSLIGFLHWLETGNLLMHSRLRTNLDWTLQSLVWMWKIILLPRCVVNQVTAGDYDCPRNVLKFLTDLHASFWMLNIRNDFLRKNFDGMKYDSRRVEEVYYDVQIGGLASKCSVQEETAQS